MALRPLVKFRKETESATEEETSQQQKQENNENQEQEEQENPLESYKREYAKRLGWTDKETFVAAGQDETRWRDYSDFLEQTPDYHKRLRDKNKEYKNRLERNAQAAAMAIEEERRQARVEAEREAREAATAGDAERAAAAVRRAAENTIPAETANWLNRNTWFNTDPEAQALAKSISDRLAAQGKSVAEQLDAAEQGVRKRFPEHFDSDIDELPDFIRREPKQNQQQEETRRETRMSQSNIGNNNSGSRNRESSSRTREKGFSDIPQADKDLYEKYFARKFASRMTVDEARTMYAKRYWSERNSGN